MENLEKYAQIYQNIINHMRENDYHLSRYEYYKYGGVAFKNAGGIIYQLLKKSKISIRDYGTLKAYITAESNRVVNKSKEGIFSTHYQYGDIVISDEQKNRIWNRLLRFMKEEDIDDLVFAGAVRVYAKNKKYIRKKR